MTINIFVNMFYLKSKKTIKSSIVLKYYVKDLKKYFEYSTGLSIEVSLWDNVTNRPVKKRSANYDYLTNITLSLNDLDSIFTKYVQNLEFNNKGFNSLDAKNYLNNKYKKQTSRKVYLLDFIIMFIKEAPNRINRNTKRKYSKYNIEEFKKLRNKIESFQRDKRRKIEIEGVTQGVYDEFFLYLEDDLEHAKNYVGQLIKALINILTIAEKDYQYNVCSDYKNKEFSVVFENVEAVALSEEEIDRIFNLELTDQRLIKYRTWLIIGVWTGLRKGDLESVEINPDDLMIELIPNKTKDKDIKVVIPIHHQIKIMLKKYGKPGLLHHGQFNESMKVLCEMAGINEMTKGSVLNPETNRKVKGVYPKYKLVSSHTCRRSFATNMYKMKFSEISIMQITGHKTQQSFLKYIKVTPKEHAEKLLEHWEQHYSTSNVVDALMSLIKTNESELKDLNIQVLKDGKELIK